MPVLSVHSISKTFIERELFKDVSFEIETKDKVGFIGANGVGKTTIFKMIKGEVSPDSGSISFSKDTTVGYMQQHACNHPGRSILDEALSIFEPLEKIQREIDCLSHQIEQKSDNLDKIISRQTMLIEEYERRGGLTYKSRTKAALIGLGFSEKDFSKPTGKLSGGQLSKLSLCKLLLSNANLLLLDEPTNHLDIKSVEWLENFLKDFKGEIIVISHDRFFLDAVTNKTIELEFGKITCYHGNYSAFIKKKEHELEAVKNKYAKDLKEIKRIEGIVEQQKRWGQAHNFITAASKQKQADKIKEQLLIPDGELETLSFSLEPKRESGNDVLICNELSKSFNDKKIFDNLSMHIRKGERVFIIGANGCGKTTLFRMITGESIPDRGEIRLGVKVDIGYFDQMQSDLDLSKSAVDEVYDAYPNMDLTQVRTILGRFMFKGDDVFKKLSSLSGGERARISLLKLMLKKGNFLLLDEPTNHLDTASREALEKTLSNHGGTMLIISHDRYFINKLANRVLEMTENGFVEHLGNYDDYLSKKSDLDVKSNPENNISKSKSKQNDYQIQKKLQSELRKRQTQLKRCEENIINLEKQIKSVQQQMSDENIISDYEKLSMLSSNLQNLQEQLDCAYEHWAAIDST